MQMDRQTLSGRLIDVQYSAQTKRDVLHLPSLTSRHSSHSTRQSTADRLIVVAFLIYRPSTQIKSYMHVHAVHPSVLPAPTPDSPLPIQIACLSNRKPGSKLQHDCSSERQSQEST